MKFSEFSLIKSFAKKIPPYSKNVIKGIGDDCAVVKISKKNCLLYTCDSMVEDVHFIGKGLYKGTPCSTPCSRPQGVPLPDFNSPQNIGRKSIAVNISDIAAMGGLPKYCLISLIIPKNLAQKIIDEVYEGIIFECKKYNIEIIGGNISAGPKLAIDIFMIGSAKQTDLIFRSGAKPGDKILVTGNLGDAGLGRGRAEARLAEGETIAKNGATSMIDISDGLASDLNHILEKSKVGACLYEKLLPISGCPLDLALYGGEDYELCFTASPENAKKIINQVKKKTGTKVSIIGEIIPKKQGKWLVLKNGNKAKLEMKGWDHLAENN